MLAEQTLHVREACRAPPEKLAETRFVLAQALWDAPRGSDATATALAGQVRDALRAAGGRTKISPRSRRSWRSAAP